MTQKYTVEIVIPTLLENLEETKDLYTRHGSLVALGCVIRGLADVSQPISDHLTGEF